MTPLPAARGRHGQECSSSSAVQRAASDAPTPTTMILGRRSSSDAGPILILIESPLGIRKSRCRLYVTTLAQSESQAAALCALSTRAKGGIAPRINPQKYSRTA